MIEEINTKESKQILFIVVVQIIYIDAPPSKRWHITRHSIPFKEYNMKWRKEYLDNGENW